MVTSNRLAAAQVGALLAKIDEGTLASDVEQLVAFGSRLTGTAGAEKTADYLYSRLAALGYQGNGLAFQEFSYSGHLYRNVLAGTMTKASPLMLLTAHCDSINGKGGPAPGADDNASGVAALLAIAGILRGVSTVMDVRFAFFGGEELDRAGSKECASVAFKKKWPLERVINLDMVAYKESPSDSVIIEVDRTSGSSTSAESLDFGVTMKQLAEAYTPLKPTFSGFYESDHVSFANEGFVCIGVREGKFNYARHTERDVIDELSFAYLANVTRMVLATVLTIAG